MSRRKYLYIHELIAFHKEIITTDKKAEESIYKNNNKFMKLSSNATHAQAFH